MCVDLREAEGSTGGAEIQAPLADLKVSTTKQCNEVRRYESEGQHYESIGDLRRRAFASPR